ncbi:MAG: 3-phosphoshikimate 1-carboxyvinyltransferase [Proteobacteria bacterium]|nr:3-phosphoshikimate 1-carboxyvinyltransferase [Pseudomonadota bacterium]
MSAPPAECPIEPRAALDARLRVPGSKSITNRALLAAALAEGESRLRGALHSDDTRYMREALAALGVELSTREEPWRVQGSGGRLRAPTSPLFVGNAGTALRFLTAAATLAPGPVTIDGNARMRERPVQDLADALVGLGASLRLEGARGCPPVALAGGGLPGGSAEIDASRSSQYVSAVVLAAPYAERDVLLRFRDGVLVSRPYVETTLEVVRTFGGEADWRGADALFVRAGEHYRGRDYAVEGDASAATYPFGAAAIAGGRVRVEGIPASSRQPDLQLLDVLARMGCRVEREPDAIVVTGPADRLRSPSEIDMNEFPDAVLTLAVVAAFAEGPTTIRNVANLRIKETDRLAALETELQRLGVGAKTGPDWLRIEPPEPGRLRGARIETYDDHRMAMAFALAGLRVPGVVILDPGCVSKTWPNYFEALRHL